VSMFGEISGRPNEEQLCNPGRRMRSSADRIAARGPMVRCATIGGQKGAVGSCSNPQISGLAALIGFG
jgi:hypothetical protein